MMDNTVLITDIDTALGEEILKTFLESGYRVFGTYGTEEGFKAIKSSYARYLGEKLLAAGLWTRGSLAGTRNIILKYRIAFRYLNHAVVLGTPDAAGEAEEGGGIDLTAFEQSVDTWIKGTVFFMREILDMYKQEKGGVLSCVCSPRRKNLKPEENLVTGAIRGFLHSLLESHRNSDISLLGFEAASESLEGYAGFIFRNMTDKKVTKSRMLRFGIRLF